MYGKVAAMLLALSLVHLGGNAFAPQPRFSITRPNGNSLVSQLQAASGNNNNNQQTLEALREQQTRLALVEAQLALQGASNSLQQVHVVGQTQLPTSRNNTGIRTDRFRTCVVLSINDIKDDDDVFKAETTSSSSSLPGILLPLTSPAQLKLLSFAKANRPLSKSVLLGLNSLLVNRDGALFDNLPWALWSVDPQQRNYDAASNPILAKFHLGKRDAYNGLMGKDWQGRSVSVGNMALRLKYLLEAEEGADSTDGENPNEEQGQQVHPEEEEVQDTTTTVVSLAERILELQIKEIEMDLAEWDYQLAVARAENKDVSSLEKERQACQSQLQESKEKMQALKQEQDDSCDPQQKGKPPSTLVSTILQDVADWTTDYGKNKAPYRGAIGYAPMLDSQADIKGSTLPYTSPYDLLREILEEQLNCEVIGAILENASLLEGTLAIGGALVLRRKTARKTITLAGEEVTINDEDENYGNVEAKGGETMLVECDADEALAMGLTCSIPIQLEPDIWDRASIMVAPLPASRTDKPKKNIREALPMWKPLDPELSLLEEGQARNESVTERASPLRMPRTTTSLFDSIFEPSPANAPSGMFPTDNPVQSLNQYDELDNEGKARTLMSMSNFEGKLPRPRALRRDKVSGRKMNSLDDLLVPLVDESVRRQILMRDAELRGYMETLEQLRNEKTKRQIAKEKAEEARMRGEEDVAEWWEAEAELYGDLRADVTQDEGSYSRFLDRDDWYERTRRQQAKKLDKNKFGTLLDGVE